MKETAQERLPRRLTMQRKLTALVICSILAVAVGLMAISYYIFCQRVNDRFFLNLQHAAEASANNLDGDFVRYFWEQISSEEFQADHDQAVKENNEDSIANWLWDHPGYYYDKLERENRKKGEETESFEKYDKKTWSLMADYEDILTSLLAIKEYFDTDGTYIQYGEGDVTYNIADLDENLFYIGTIEKPIPEFDAYPGNTAVPPTIYHSDFGWLCTVMEPVREWETDEVVALAGVDLNMTEIVKERYAFLTNSLVFVALLLLVSILASVGILERTAVRPLRQLADAATRFAKENRAFTRDDVINLDIRTNDEVGDLYREIRSMEERIVDYTEHLTAVTAEKERVSTELRTAFQIQEAMLPNVFPAFPDREDFDLYASMTPAKEVGGDFYDFMLIDDSHLAVLIADVSDKGVPAALFMMSSKILLNYCAQMGGSPGEILSAVNAQICKSNDSRMFVTVWLGILDLETGILTCSNAGHEYPLIRGQDGAFRIFKDKHGLVVGALAKSKYKDYEIQMQPGDAIFVYTDGIPEANNAEGDFYGLERLEATLNSAPMQDPRRILEHVKADVDAFTGEAKQFDDLTMLCLAYKGKR